MSTAQSQTKKSIIFDMGGVVLDWRADRVSFAAFQNCNTQDKEAITVAFAALEKSIALQKSQQQQNLFASTPGMDAAKAASETKSEVNFFLVAEQLFGKQEWQQIDRGTLEVEKGAEMAAKRLNIPLSFVLDAYHKVPESLIPFPETVDLMRRLYELGYPLYILSNMPPKCLQHLVRSYDFWKYTKGWTISSIEKLQKPEPEIYQRLIDSHGLTPSNCIFIDDVHVNTQGAEKFGINTILFKNPQQTKEELEKRFGITVQKKKVIIGSDHGGFALKQDIIANVKEYEFIDMGVYKNERVDYPTYAKAVCTKVVSGEYELGILVCGTGIGISIAANKFNGIRCALCHDHFTAKLTRQHNNANVMALGGRTTGPEVAFEMVRTFIETKFEGGRHQERLDMIASFEQEQGENLSDEKLGSCCKK